MSISDQEIEEFEQRKREYNTKLRMHEASMGGNIRLPRKSKKETTTKEPWQPKGPLKEIEKSTINREPTETQEELVQKYLGMADKIKSTKGVQNMVSNPIVKSVASNKNPDFSSTPPNQVRPIKVNDTMADILAKMYNLMIFKYNYDNKKHKADKKYRKVLQDLRERHIEELIGLFGGKYKKVKSKEEKEEKKGKETAKKEESSFLSGILSTLKKGVDKALSIFKKPATQAALSTAIKVAAGVAGTLTGAAALSARLEVGYGTKSNLGPGAVVKDPGGGYSYGYFGINSKGGDRSPIASFIRENPQFGLKSKPETKEFESEWKSLAASRGDELTQAQQDWYNKHVLSTVVSDYSKILPTNIISDERVQAYLADRRNQYGNTYDKPGIVANKNATTPEEFIKRLSKYDSEHLKENFRTALTTDPTIKVGLENRIKNRESGSLGPLKSFSPVINSVPPSINIPPDPKQLNKQSSPTSDSISMLNNTTNIAHGGTTYLTEEEKANRPALIEKTYYG